MGTGIWSKSVQDVPMVWFGSGSKSSIEGERCDGIWDPGLKNKNGFISCYAWRLLGLLGQNASGSE